MFTVVNPTHGIDSLVVGLRYLLSLFMSSCIALPLIPPPLSHPSSVSLLSPIVVSYGRPYGQASTNELFKLGPVVNASSMYPYPFILSSRVG